MKLLKSETAYKQGFGSATYREVSGLTKAEKEAYRNGTIVYFDCGELSGGNNKTGTKWRIIKEWRHNRFDSRVPGNEILTAIETIEKE